MITATDLAQQLRNEIDRSITVLQHIANMIEALDAWQVRVNEPDNWPVCITMAHPVDSGTIGKLTSSEEQGATESG